MSSIRHLACKTNPVQRANGGNAVAAAAYRAGQNLRDEASGKMHRYAGRAPDVNGSVIRTPEGAPDWLHDRAALWNSAEARETRKDARTGRDLVLGLAWELTPEERRAAVIEFADREFVSRGHVVDISFHSYGAAVREQDRIYDQQSGEYVSGAEKIAGWKEAGLPFLEAHQVQGVDMPHVKIERGKDGEITGRKIFQPHAHVLASPRAWDSEAGDWAEKKDPHFNKSETAKEWRYEWPKLQNRYLEAAGWEVRVSCTSGNSDDALPVKSETLPNQAYHIERRDILQESTTAHKAAEFNRAHNEAIRAAYEDLATQGTPEGEEASQRVSVALWWRNMANHVHAWRDDLSEAAQEWRLRFEQQRSRVQALIGRDIAPRDPGPDTPQPDHRQVQEMQLEPPERGQEPEL